ncbi:YadA C-terminal domain-containing protein [Acinetobacter sp. YH12029]|uniref:YadA C-terminal domain-containing protein n=1 Tax=Acinetobacter sp. YH12029 TaxID=2601044 RepID=UPI00211E587C|nr:YadA C-terminal domain-containing protein [Acinetobacter sp. YH12029]
MKFQKTLLAASLAIVATSSVSAAVVTQEAKPVQVTENLVNLNQIYGGNGVNQLGQVEAPVHGIHATNTPNLDLDIDWLPEIGILNNGTHDYGIDLGTRDVNQVAQPGSDVKYDVFKYKTLDGTTVYQFENPLTGAKIPGTYVADASGNLAAYSGSSPIDVNTLAKGGQISGLTGSTLTTGYEHRQVNGEHVIYGYQGGTSVNAGSVEGTIVAPEGSSTEEYLQGTLGQQQVASDDIRYVQTGILANTGTGPVTDPSKNIYGLSARDNANVTMLTGNGIALADLSNKGTLQTDGSVASSVLVKSQVSGTQKTREYDVNGKRVLEVYNNDEGRKLDSTYYEITGNGTGLVEWTGTTPVAGTHIKTGTAQYDAGTFEISKVHNTVTNKNVTYSESVSTTDQTRVQAGITTPGSATTNVDTTFDKTAPQIKVEQAVSTGVIGKNADGSNKYGTEVVKTDANGTQKTEITASGINTTGVINAADYQIGGVSIVDGIKTSVDTAVAGATEAIDAKVAEVDTKIVEVDARLTQFNTTAANLNSRVDQLNSRVNEVEETAYRGVAIALAAQQQIPNIGAGQFAVFGGVGHYEGESAGALGVASVFADGRTSLSAAIGVAGGSEVGGRVGLSYVFGGK